MGVLAFIDGLEETVSTQPITIDSSYDPNMMHSALQVAVSLAADRRSRSATAFALWQSGRTVASKQVDTIAALLKIVLDSS